MKRKRSRGIKRKPPGGMKRKAARRIKRKLHGATKRRPADGMKRKPVRALKRKAAAGIKRKPPGSRRCEHCKARLTRALVSVYRRRRARHFLLQKVPALLCRSCGHRVYEMLAMEAMDRSIERFPQRASKSTLYVVPLRAE